MGGDAGLVWPHHGFAKGTIMTMLIWFCIGFGSASCLLLFSKLQDAYAIRNTMMATCAGKLEPDENGNAHLLAGQPKTAQSSAPPSQTSAIRRPSHEQQLERKDELIERLSAALDKQSEFVDQTFDLRKENRELKRVLNTCRQTHDLCDQAFQRLDKEQGAEGTTALSKQPVH
ncbi:hypothetical protein [uncultured Pelagimonas sp.]|uniref:hypothetical protein n=1 Tax=uncultured Pelagimonas sp. TaxID=1618102 RepID=UPI00260A1EC4|nr:hypothetical protein [uncultured Pelagimonas sp.]